jgi:hypothetical protein
MPRSIRHSARLKKAFKEGFETFPEPARIRIHRALSWLARAEAEPDDHDARFIFLWIAFNAAYAREFGLEGNAREQLAAFFERLLALDTERWLAALLLEQFSGPIRTMIGNKYVFEPFWRALREHDASERWKAQFDAAGKLALRAVLDGRADLVLSVVFDRLYVLRNQLVHGGATWNSRVNRAQVSDGANLLMATVPMMIELMLDHPESDFGEILYPVLP